MKDRGHSVGYFSSYDRGLQYLLKMWPRIHEQVPDATLDIYYGWNTFDKMFAGNPEGMKWKWNIIRDLSTLKEFGVREHGRVNHKALIEATKKCKVWAYPTEFTEISCITAMRAQACSCIPVYTNVAALGETVINDKYKVDAQDIYTNDKAQDEFVANVVAALKSKDYTIKQDPMWAWTNIAKEWDSVCTK